MDTRWCMWQQLETWRAAADDSRMLFSSSGRVVNAGRGIVNIRAEAIEWRRNSCEAWNQRTKRNAILMTEHSPRLRTRIRSNGMLQDLASNRFFCVCVCGCIWCSRPLPRLGYINAALRFCINAPPVTFYLHHSYLPSSQLRSQLYTFIFWRYSTQLSHAELNSSMLATDFRAKKKRSFDWHPILRRSSRVKGFRINRRSKKKTFLAL